MKRILSNLTSPFMLKCYGWGLLAIILLIAAFYAEENWRGAREWEAARKYVESQGTSLDIQTYILPPVPDEQNFCAIPLFKNYLADKKRIHKKFDSTSWDDLEKKSENIQKIVRMSGANPDIKKLTPRNRPRENNFDEWKNYYLENPSFSKAHPNINAVDAILSHFKEQSGEWNALHEATKRPFAQLEGRLTDRYYIEFLSNNYHLGMFIDLTKGTLLKGKASFASHFNAEGLQTVQILLKLSQINNTIPSFLEELCLLFPIQSVTGLISQPLKNRSLKFQELDSMESQFKSIDIPKKYLRGVHDEILYMINSIDYLKTHSCWDLYKHIKSYHDELYPIFSKPSEMEYIERVLSVKINPSGWYDMAKARNVLNIQKYMVTSVSPEKHLFYPDIVEKGYSVVTSPTSYSFADVSTHSSFISLAASVIKFAQTQANVDMAIIACELEKYYLKNRKYPETLDALKADLPHDVMSGEPYHYARTPDGRYKIWSVGWNGSDEGGSLSYKKDTSRKVVEPKEGDWVWSYEE